MPRAPYLIPALVCLLACSEGQPSTADSPAAGGTTTTAERPVAETSFDTLNAAWWVSWRIPPSDTAIEGIPVRQLDSTWTAATALATVTPPAAALDTTDTFRMLGARFTTDGDFNRDGRPDRALVGTYRARDGEEGRFVAVLTRAASGAWEPAWVYTLPGAPGFSALIDGPRGNEPTWIECLECDTSTDIRWRGTGYVAIVHSCCDDEPRTDSSGGARPPDEVSDDPAGYMLSQ